MSGARLAEKLAQVGQEFGHGFDLSLGRIEAALARLDRPQDRLPPTIHVAGTNGKGSTCAFLRAIGEAAGLRVHVFTSPHLIRPNERIRLAGRLVDDEPFIEALDRVAATGVTVTYFEATTAAALDLFARTPADLLVLEVGLGGRVDATNVVDPAVSVIAPVDLDHQAFLGDTIAQIAGEKAGILKPGRPAVIARQHADAAAVIDAAAAQVKAAPLLRCGVEWDGWRSGERLVVQTPQALLDLPPPALIGAHQYDNAALAVMAARTLGDPRIDDAALARGIANAVWPARMQPLRTGDLASAANGCELWLDGGHNPHAARALAAALEALARRRQAPTTLVVGMLANKDAAGFLEPLRAQADRLIAVPVRTSQSGRDPAELAALASSLGFAATHAAHLIGAVGEAAQAAPRGRILICGSLYLAGDALALSGGVT